MIEDRPHGLGVAQETTIETLARRDRSALRPGYPAITVIGVGVAGDRLVDALAGEHTGGNTEFARVALAGSADRGHGGSTGSFLDIDAFEATRFRDADLVMILAGADDVIALELSGVIARAARRAGAQVIGILAHEATLPVDRPMLAAVMQYSVDALVLLPATPHVSILRGVFDAYIHATVPGYAGSFGPVVPVGADFLDARAVFAGCTDARTGIGHSNEVDRAHWAANRAMMKIGLPRIRQASGLLILIAGSRSLRLREVADAVDAVDQSAPEEARMSLGVHYDNRLGDVLRVTIITTTGVESG
ncbi:hypothetical protein [Paraburkholderia sp.]|uniref:hypothetical protein n=1 Tax=Paraburkholderia sp. TaxID=1926495 RepID=UPI003D701118